MTSISRARRTESATAPASAWSSESAGFAWRTVVSPARAVTLVVAARVALARAASAAARATPLASPPPRPHEARALVRLGPQPEQRRPAPAVGVGPVAEVLDRAARQLPLGAVGGGVEPRDRIADGRDLLLTGVEAGQADMLQHGTGVSDVAE